MMENAISKKLFNDYVNFLKLELDKFGLKFTAQNKEPIDIALAYFNWQKKLISSTPRQVYLSKEFKCPSHLKSELDYLVESFKNGIDVSGYLSKNLNFSSRHDELLYDWGIHHLHFYDHNKGGARSSELIFAYVTDQAIYLLDIKDHGSFEDTDLLEILDSNWSELTDPFWIKSEIGVSNSVTNEDRKRLRKAKINVASVVLKNGKVLMSCMIGGGISASGDNGEVVQTVLNIQNTFDDIGEYIEKVITHNVDTALEPIFNKYSQFYLAQSDSFGWCIFNPKTNAHITLNDLQHKIQIYKNQKVY